MIDIGADHFVDPNEVAFIRALPKDIRGQDRVDVILKSGFMFSISCDTFDAAQGLMRNIKHLMIYSRTK